MPNHNEKTGIAFGYISANALDPDVVYELMYEYGTDLDMEELQLEYAKEMGFDGIEQGLDEFVNEHSDEFQELYDNDCNEEPTIEGKCEGVHYMTSWLGGVLNFFIFESPEITNEATLCSPCVPGAGDIDELNGNMQAYNVPDEWRETNF